MVFSRKQEPSPTSNSSDAFTKRADERSVIAHQNHASANAPAQSVIGNDLSIEGETITIRCKGSLRVNGDIQADLHSQELEVGREGRITGSIAADTVNVFGHVNGAIQGGQVILHASAEVDGDIHSGNLAIESGASFDGRSRKAHDQNEIRPQLEKPASANSTDATHHSPAATAQSHASNGITTPTAHASVAAQDQKGNHIAASPFTSQTGTH